ncbi:AAA family ATPase [Methanolobus sp. ZRKC2]|uniref:AAA family ATPase n=1 Tax=Methanolobus sp. ZRKC2 TaxID=3125783 RepID=UPI00324A7211
MIERIDTIKNFGIYKDLTFCAPDFKKYNLIYGWNYSGKTTLSRLFRCIELNNLHLDFSDAQFELTDINTNRIKHDSLDNSSYQFRIFNTDFVNDNLYWDDQEANPIFILGEEDIELQKQIEELDTKIDNLQNEKEDHRQEKLRHLDDLEKKLTDKARELNRIKTPYNKSKLKKTLEVFRDTIDEYFLNERELGTLIETINTPSKDKISEISFHLLDKEKIENFRELLERTVIAQTIEKLKANPELNNWIQKGLILHRDKNQCEFCGNQLDVNLLEAYENHFSKEYEIILSELNAQIAELNTYQISLSIPDEKRVNPQLEDGYIKAKDNLDKSINTYNDKIKEVSDLLNKKMNNPFDKYTDSFPIFSINLIIEDLNALNEIINKHNNICDNFQNEQTEAFTKIELHYACEFNKDNDYYIKLDELLEFDIKITSIVDEIREHEASLKEIKSNLSDIGKAAEKINGELQSIFGKEHIKLEAIENNKFQILREGREAKNLSEGEKTAIAFSYFLTRLEDQDTDISNAIIFIDDPISSLDSNHLYNTFAVIKSKLEDCNQLFISTHNFEFFNLMKDWFKGIRGNREKCRYYLIERITKDTAEVSDIRELPSFLLNYKSEYHYLFYKIKSFDDNPTTDFENLYQLPNITRRFLEAFTGFKYSFGLKKGLELLIENESNRIKVDKFVNNFSHQTGLSRSLILTDVHECNSILHIVLEAVKAKDLDHYTRLEEIYSEATTAV